MRVAQSVPQHLSALARANEIRLSQAALKREVKTGATSIVDALRDERAAAMSIYDLLHSQQRWGVVRARTMCQRFRIGEMRRVRDLTERQLRELEVALTRGGPRSFLDAEEDSVFAG